MIPSVPGYLHAAAEGAARRMLDFYETQCRELDALLGELERIPETLDEDETAAFLKHSVERLAQIQRSAARFEALSREWNTEVDNVPSTLRDEVRASAREAAVRIERYGALCRSVIERLGRQAAETQAALRALRQGHAKLRGYYIDREEGGFVDEKA